MILIDANYLVALMQPRDQLHARAVAWSKRMQGELLVLEYALRECLNAMSRPIDRPKVHTVVQSLRSSPTMEIVVASEGLFERSLEFHRSRPDKSWSLTDCASFLVMEERNISQSLTHDRHFEEAGFEALLRRDPD